MANFTRDEIEAAFDKFQAAARHRWQHRRLDRVVGVLHRGRRVLRAPLRTVRGPPAILEWITTTMAEPINRDMIEFPIDWYVIDEARGWVLCAVWNQMADPGDGSVHREINWTKLHYAGDGKFYYEEDIYNPSEFAAMIKGWLAAKKRAARARS